MIIKPVVWLLPILFFLKKENENLESVGITFKRLFPSIYFALTLGAIFAIEGLVVNYLKYQGTLTFNANLGQNAILLSLGFSLATAIPEEIAFRGFIFNRLWKGLGKEWQANILSSILWTAIHLPVTLLTGGEDFAAMALYLILTFLYGVGAAFVFARTRNVIAPILLHVLWETPISLFR